MQWISWLTAILSLTGVVLNIRKRRECFYLWAVSNSIWCCIDLYHGIYAQAALMAVYFGLAIWGIVAWRGTDATTLGRDKRVVQVGTKENDDGTTEGIDRS